MSNSMTEEAIASDSMMGVPLYPVDEIYADPDFNCRGVILPIEVIDLAKSIAVTGLQQPIVIRPRVEGTPPQYKYVCVSGHRRHKAYEVNGAELVPCILRDNLDEFRARTLNAQENLKREDLNKMQEARCVEPYLKARWSRKDIARELGFGEGWVQIRTMLLNFEPEIQEIASAGLLNDQHIRQLNGMKTSGERFNAVKLIKDQKARSEGKRAVVISKATDKHTKKQRGVMQMLDLASTMIDIFGTNMASRSLAWACGNVSDQEIHEDIQTEASKIGKTYNIPDFEAVRIG